MTKSTKQTTKKTAGDLHLKAKAEEKMDPLEVAHAQSDEVYENLVECAKRHEPIFKEDEFFVCLNIAHDPMLASVRRYKYWAWLFLPTPRPNQCVFLYKKADQSFKRLWCLPAPHVMATISETSYVAPAWQSTKRWCDSFYRQTFWEDIRKEHGINHLSEHEYRELHRDELLDASKDDVGSLGTDTFDFSKVGVNKVADKRELIVD